MVAYYTLWKLVTWGQRSRSQWRKILFFFNFLFASLLCFLALLRPIKMNFGMLLRYALSRLANDSNKNRIGDDIWSLWRHLIFSISEQNQNQMDALISIQFSLNGCLLHWLKSYQTTSASHWIEKKNFLFLAKIRIHCMNMTKYLQI